MSKEILNARQFEVVDCELCPDGLHLVFENDKGDVLDLRHIKLTLSEAQVIKSLSYSKGFEQTIEVTGHLYSKSTCSQIRFAPPSTLEVTIEDIEKKFGRKVKIVGDTK